MFKTALTIARYDVRMFFRDRTAVLLTLALPILLVTIFGSAMTSMFGGDDGESKEIAVLVEDLDGTPASERLVRSIGESGGLRAVEASDSRRQVAGGDYAAAIVIPKGYGASLAEGTIPRVTLLRDPSQQIAQQVIAGNLMPVLMQSTFEHVGPEFMETVLDRIDFPARGRDDAATEPAPLAETLDETEDGEDAGGFNFLEDVPAMLGLDAEDVAGQDDTDEKRAAGGAHAIASMAVMMLMFSLVGAGGTLLEERDNGTLLRLQLAPSAGSAILVGKMLSMGLIGLMQLTMLYIYGQLLFSTPIFERPLSLLLVTFGLLLAATGLGILFAVVCTSRKQLEGISTLVILVMSAVGGAWFPREFTPDWFQTVGLFTVTAWAMDAYHGILWYGKGLLPTADLDGIWLEVGMLYLIGAVLVGASFRLYERRFVERA